MGPKGTAEDGPVRSTGHVAACSDNVSLPEASGPRLARGEFVRTQVTLANNMARGPRQGG